MDPLPLPLPETVTTFMETTDGFTTAAILFTSMVGAPSVSAVLVVEQPFEPARKIAWVFLSTHTLTPSGSDVAAVATPPATDAPKRKATMIFTDDFFMSTSFATASFHRDLRESLKRAY